MTECRPYTKEEAEELFLERIWILVEYWTNLKKESEKDKLEGLAFSILNMFDGTSGGWPAMDIVLRPHPDDEEYCKKIGKNYWVDGMYINDGTMLHEKFYK